jgi:predicted RNA-binding protein with PIN domain
MALEFEKFLAHFGIKGMRWGVRRDRGPAGTVSSNPSVKSVSDLDDDTLQAAVRRMRLEQEFSTLVAARTPAQTQKADGFIKKLLKENGKRQITRLAKSASDIALERALTKHGTNSAGQERFSGEVAKALKKAREKK